MADADNGLQVLLLLQNVPSHTRHVPVSRHPVSHMHSTVCCTESFILPDKLAIFCPSTRVAEPAPISRLANPQPQQTPRIYAPLQTEVLVRAKSVPELALALSSYGNIITVARVSISYNSQETETRMRTTYCASCPTLNQSVAAAPLK